jgi:hypothetical protein
MLPVGFRNFFFFGAWECIGCPDMLAEHYYTLDPTNCIAMPAVKSIKKQLTREEISERLMELSKKIPEVADQLSQDKIWCQIGHLKYGLPVTELLLEYKALMWLQMNPPDPRGEKMCSRPGPYVVRADSKDLAYVLNLSERSVQRAMQKTREWLKEMYPGKSIKWITVEQFCFFNGLPEDVIQKKLHQRFEERWNMIKNRQKKDDDDE